MMEKIVRKVFLVMPIGLLLSINILISKEFPRRILRIDLNNQKRETVEKLFRLGIDFLQINRLDSTAEVLVSESEFQKIKNLGLKVKILCSDADAFARELLDSRYLKYFRTYNQMLQEMNEIVAYYPDIAKMQDIGDSYEKTAGKGGYDIWVMKISDHVEIEEDEAEVFFMANISAREIVTPEIIMYFMHYLIDNYGKDPSITYLVNNRQIWLCPTVNPDGHEYCFTGSEPYTYDYPGNPIWWRKNKRDNDSDGSFNPYFDGVDLDRNFGYMWGYDDVGSSQESTSPNYRGTAEFSEPESQAIRDFVMKHNFIITLSFHSYGPNWLYPWGYTSILAPDRLIFRKLSDGCVSYNKYISCSVNEFTPANGNADDWFYGEQTIKNKIYALTPQVGSADEGFLAFGFFPDTLFLEKQILENQEPMIYLTYVAGEEPVIIHSPLPDTAFHGPHQVIATVLTPITLTLSSPIDQSGIKLFYRMNEVALFDSVVMIPMGNNNEYSAFIPATESEGRIYYYIRALDQNGRTGSLPKGAPMATYSFYVSLDLEAPTIFHTPIDHGSISATEFPVRAIITDNVKVDNAWIIYRKNNDETDSLAMTPIPKQHEYFATIPGNDIHLGDFYEYKILAIDNAFSQNTTQAPDSGYFKFYIRNSILLDFEADSCFIPISGSDWQWGVPESGPEVSFSGSKVWATNLTGNYNNLKESILETPEIELAGQDSSRLIFWHWYINEFSDNTFWDGGNIKISIDGGAFEIIDPIGGYDGIIDRFAPFLAGEPCFGGPEANGNFWQREIFDLTPYLGRSIKIRFDFGADGYVSKPGWYIDYVEILLERITSVKPGMRFANYPEDFELCQNYPNPFNPTTEIEYHLSESAMVTLEIFNLLGQKVIFLVNEHQAAGNYHINWNGMDSLNREVKSGVYFYRLIINRKGAVQSFIKKMVKLE